MIRASRTTSGKEPAGKLPVSCGTLVQNESGKILLCHATGTLHWDIPKGMQEAGESPLEAARRELQEETGLQIDPAAFKDLGCFAYRKVKRLHLYKVRVPDDPQALDRLSCISCFTHRLTGKPTPEVDAYRWATRDEIATLCWPRMAERLLALDW